VSFDLESPHKRLREVSVDGLEPLRKTKSEPTSPYQSPITPTSPMPTLDPKTDRLSTSLKGSKPSSEIINSAPTIEKLQKENHQLLQQLEERKTIDTHLHHDNAVLQEKVNSLQRLVDEMTKSNRNLRAQLKQHKRHKAKSSQQEGEASKVDPPQQA
jgi:septal ring factor EnvC (AmiA/AmiB activator)